MRNLLFSTVAALALAATPALAAPPHHDTTHRTVHTTTHTSHGTRHTTRHVTTHSTTHASRGRHHTGSWHGTSHHRTGSHTGVHLSVNLGGLRANIRSGRRYHYTGQWHRPSGWYARRWAYGQRLPGGWYGRDYWLNGYIDFGLTAPPDGYEWIREGNDAVLVNIDTGEIIRVVYDVFY
jgi:Ni/Co efflux regulator RcnB